MTESILYRSIASLVLASSLAAVEAQSTGLVPSTAPSALEGHTAPAWVAADVAVRNGQLQESLFHAAEAEALRQFVAQLRTAQHKSDHGSDSAPETKDLLDCKWLRLPATADWERGKPHGSLEDLTAHSLAIYRGTVREARLGFYYGEVGFLLAVEVSRVIKLPWDRSEPKHILVFYPHGAIAVGGEKICTKGFREPLYPRLGSELLVFSYRVVGSTPNEIIYPLDEDLFFTVEATVSAPQRLYPKVAFPDGTSLDLFETEARRWLAESKHTADAEGSEPR